MAAVLTPLSTYSDLDGFLLVDEDSHPGKGGFTWDVQNVHIYDRNIAQAVEELRREPVDCEPHLVLNDNIHDFYEFKPKDIQVKGYPKQKIMTKNPEIKFNS